MILNILRKYWKENSAFRYLVVGLWNTAFSLGFLYFLFFTFTNKHYELELAATFAISTIQSFNSQRRVVWKAISRPADQFIYYILSTLSQYIFSSLLLFLSVHNLKLKPEFASLPIMAILTLCFYFINKNFVFNYYKDDPS
jgi:putative flippase GtrA